MKKLLFTILISTFILSCSSIQTIKNRKFVMNSPYFNQILDITFENNYFHGHSTINSFSAEYSLSGSYITIKNFKQTQNTGSYSKTLQENYILDVIKNSKQLIVTNNEIILKSSNGNYIKYHDKIDLVF